jgi:uncharacterized protein (DUF488 family)
MPTQPLTVQMQNREDWNNSRSRDEADFFTIGYMRRSITDVIEALADAGVTTLIDIRRNAVSMYKPDFSKRNLQRYLRSSGLEYLHLPDIGVPRHVRALSVGKGHRQDIWAWYDNVVVPEIAGRNLTRFFNAFEHPIALMCLELDPTECHRHRLALALERVGLQSYDL